jgi:hypothetical protein
VVINFWEIDATTIFGEKQKMVAEDPVDNFVESLNGSRAHMIRLRTALSYEFR